MREQIERQLESLRREQEAGTKMLEDLEARRAELQQTLLRIAGAVHVLQELLEPGEESEDEPPTEDPAA